MKFFDLNDKDDFDFLMMKFTRSPEFRAWKSEERKREKERNKRHTLEDLEVLSAMLTAEGQNHRKWVKDTSGKLYARLYIKGTNAYVTPSGDLNANGEGAVWPSQLRKINKALRAYFVYLENIVDVRGDEVEMEFLRMLVDWAQERYTIEGTFEDTKKYMMKSAFDSYGKAYGGYSTHSLPTRNAEKMGESKPKKKRKENPKSIDRYVNEYAEQKGYSSAEDIPKNEKGKAYAIAWSRYCSKRPNSPRCKKEKGTYFPNRPNIAKGIEKSMAEKRKKRQKKAMAERVAYLYEMSKDL